MPERDEAAVRLVIVEDDDPAREELERILGRQTSFLIDSYARPGAALAGIAKAKPDLALIDLKLPEMDGIALLERMRERAPDLMAIIMTGYGEAETARSAREHGAADFVEKPLDLPYLLVTLRQQAREALLRRNLRASGELFSRVLDLMPDGLVMTDGKGDVLFSNQLGRTLWATGPRDPGGQRVHEGRVYGLERTAAGDRVLWHWTDLTGALERERAAGYRQMARLLAHEIRNPLTPMRLWLQELDALSPGDPRFLSLSVEAVRVLLQQVDRLTALVDRFKALGEERPLALAPVEVPPVAQEVLAALAPLAEQAGVALDFRREEGAPASALADEASLYHLLFNLVRNGIEACRPRGGRVRVLLEASGQELRLSVEDDGGGLPPEVAAAPFTPYLTTKEGGTGLGLILCRELAARIGAQFRLEDHPGQGVAAVVTLRGAGA
jgi:signal transduction histidine kinase